MKVISLLLIAMALLISTANAQTPYEFNYQAVLRNADGSIISNEDVTIDISILQGSANGPSVFDESHNVTTTIQGVVNLHIGSVSDLSIVNWGADVYFVEISLNGTLMGASELLSVPYALTAKTVETVDYNVLTNQPDLSQYIIHESDPVFEASEARYITATDIDNWNNNINTDTQLDEAAVDAFVANNGYITSADDADATNEIQDISLSGTNLTISKGSTIDISMLIADTQLDEEAVDAFVANNGYLSSEVDGSVTNEIQDISLSGTELTISDGSTIDLSVIVADTQLDEAAVDTFVANNGYISSEVDGSVTNEIQDISLSGTELTISNGSTIDLSAIDTDTQLDEATVDGFVSNNGYITNADDADADATNEIQTLILTGNELSLSGGNTVFLTPGAAYTGGDGIEIDNGVISNTSKHWSAKTQMRNGRDTTLYIKTITGGLASHSAVLKGDSVHTHINLGFNSISSIDGVDSKYITISGGKSNTVKADYSTIGGGVSNIVTNEIATIGGGHSNEAKGNASTIGGGYMNITDGYNSTVSGGFSNQALSVSSTVSGGNDNEANAANATVSGGGENTASKEFSTVSGGSANIASGLYSTISGGELNVNEGLHATISGGYENSSAGEASTIGGGESNITYGDYQTISGGYGNVTGTEGDEDVIYATIVGGEDNSASAEYSFVGGGYSNSNDGIYGTISGGEGNDLIGEFATISGGSGNTVFGNYSTISGGESNSVDGDYSSSPGGQSNEVHGDNSWAGGTTSMIDANHSGTFLWSDANGSFNSEAANEFAVKATGGVRFVTEAGVKIGNGTSFYKLPNVDGEAGQVLQTDGAGNLKWVDQENNQENHYVGEFYGGGIVFYTYDNGQHGLILSIEDLHNVGGDVWSNITGGKIGDEASYLFDGSKNMSAIQNQAGHMESAAKTCTDYVGGSFTDWYLPSSGEMAELLDVLFEINRVLVNDGDESTQTLDFTLKYWTSREYSDTSSYVADVKNYEKISSLGKYSLGGIRAVRKF